MDMKNFSIWTKRLAQQAIAVTSLIGASTGTAWAVASQTGSTLQVTGDAGPDSIEIEVGPIAGMVTLYGVLGVPDGQIFNNVSKLVVATLGGDDSLKFFVKSANVDITTDTSTGADSIVVDMMTPQGLLSASALFAFDTGTGNDTVELKLESYAPQFDLASSFFRSTDEVETVNIALVQQVTGAVNIDLTANQAFTVGNFGLVAKGPAVFDLNGEIRSLETKIEIDGNATGNLQLTGEAFPSTIEYLVTGSLNGSPGLIANSSFSDSLKLFVEGGIIGTPMIDGSTGLGDSCDASPGVLIVNCDGP